MSEQEEVYRITLKGLLQAKLANLILQIPRKLRIHYPPLRTNLPLRM